MKWLFLLPLTLVFSWVNALSYEAALKIASKDGLLHVTDKNYRDLMKNEDYGFILFLTAEDSRVGCTLCHQFGPQYKAIANQYVRNLQDLDDLNDHPKNSKSDKSRVIFGYSDFLDARKFFEELQLTAVPRLFYYEPGKAPQLSVFSNEFSFLAVENTDGFSRWVQQNVPGLSLKLLDVVVPQSNSMLFTVIVIGFLISIVLYSYKDTILHFIQSKALWEFLCLALTILFLSGHMYNQIRDPSTTKTDKDGNTIYFAAGHTQQYAAETQIVSIVYGILSVALIALIQFIPKMKSSFMRVLVTVGISFVVFILYSFLLEAYRLKSTGYPFHLWNAFSI
jgi:oligosaccharyltransferase complex subunit gamma